MPGVNTWFPSTPSASEKVFGGAADEFSEQPAKGDDFDRLMQATLAPQPHKSPDRHPIPTGRSHPVAQSSTARSTAAPGNAIAPATAEKTHDTAAGEKVDAKKKSTADTDGKTSTDVNPPAVPAAATETLPVFLSLPQFLPGTFSASFGDSLKAGKAGAAEKISPDGDQAGGKPASTTQQMGPGANGNGLSLKSLALIPDGGSPTGTGAPAVAAQPENNRPGKATAEKGVPSADSTAATDSDENAPKLEPQADSTANLASKSASESGINTADKGSNPVGSNSLEQAAENAGTGVATMDLQMKNQLKTNKVAGQDAKVLPVGENGAVGEKNLPSQLPVTPVRAADNRGMDFNFSFSNGNSQASATENTPVLNVIDLPSLTDARMRALDRTQDMMALHAMRLVESKSDVLSVVIKPTVGTELSLELQVHPEGIQARATLTRGDHEFLNQHWPELQQRLEQRGIKLAPLGGETDFSANGDRHFQRQQTAQEEAAQQASAFAEFAAAGGNGGASARLAVLHDGWESWA
ncbi:MAG TPA: hypothetical protein VH251_03005 [Verrucomicrobiae bacterium]|nr:hypothetical protein [Verrucomicrobiae bacterium]